MPRPIPQPAQLHSLQRPSRNLDSYDFVSDASSCLAGSVGYVVVLDLGFFSIRWVACFDSRPAGYEVVFFGRCEVYFAGAWYLGDFTL